MTAMLTPLEHMDVSEKEQDCHIRVSSSFVCVLDLIFGSERK